MTEVRLAIACLKCGDRFRCLSSLRKHTLTRHAGLTDRERSLALDGARRAAGWWGAR
jgi:hypothetical protein